jgi:hypothetical protein
VDKSDFEKKIRRAIAGRLGCCDNKLPDKQYIRQACKQFNAPRELARIAETDAVAYQLLFATKIKARQENVISSGHEASLGLELSRAKAVLALEKKFDNCLESKKNIMDAEEQIATLDKYRAFHRGWQSLVYGGLKGQGPIAKGRPTRDWGLWAFMLWWWLCEKHGLKPKSARVLVRSYFRKIWPKSAKGGLPYNNDNSFRVDLLRIKRELMV